ncbi:hypothetical protein P5673_012648 [Acropora cervicornis]|uniref:Uncharacterized protein n=1 Tax=Acropora cervicornis TaxID=6130 RepID=A0AAD9QLU3_ACRCE|nr:hypothetical protein P5673_012648 [Acropora cervicornis]
MSILSVKNFIEVVFSYDENSLFYSHVMLVLHRSAGIDIVGSNLICDSYLRKHKSPKDKRLNGKEKIGDIVSSCFLQYCNYVLNFITIIPFFFL